MNIRNSFYTHIFLSLLLYFLMAPVLAAQDDTDEDPLLNIGFRYHKGFIIQHSQKLKDEITNTNPWIIEGEFAWHLRNKNVWSYCYCYPRTGIAIRYIDFDLPDILGSSVSAYGFIEPFINIENRLNYSIRFGLGPAYLTKIYDEQTNPDNLFFSSRISFIVMLNASVNYRLNDKLGIRLAADYNHISNGGYSEPNLGMNFPSVNAGIEYNFRAASFDFRDRDEQNLPDIEKNRFDISYGFSLKPPSYNIREGLYPVHCFALNYSRRVGRIFALSAGIEWINNRSLKALVEISNLRDSSGNYLDHNLIAPLAGVEWLFGRFVFSQHFGYYIYSPVKPNRQFYQRYGLVFHITDHLFSGVNVKAHAQDADFIDVRFGISF